MLSPTPVVEREREEAPDDSTDSSRREAIARQLCARLCDERRTTDELEQVDSLLTLIDEGFDPASLLGRLFHDRYNEDEGSSDLERAKRRGHNSGMRHATSLYHLHTLHRGITEFRRQVTWPTEENFDDANDAAPAVSRTRAMDFDLGGES